MVSANFMEYKLEVLATEVEHRKSVQFGGDVEAVNMDALSIWFHIFFWNCR